MKGGKPPKCKPYTPEEKKLLGTMPDEELARKTRRTVFAVQARRIALKITKFNLQRRPWTAEELALLGKILSFLSARCPFRATPPFNTP